MYPNRTLCDVLEEMRKAVSTLNFSYILSLIEEAQSLGNRMEAALEDAADVRNLTETRSKLKKEVKRLCKKVDDAGGNSNEIRYR